MKLGKLCVKLVKSSLIILVIVLFGGLSVVDVSAEEFNSSELDTEDIIPEGAELLGVEELGDGFAVYTYEYENNNNIVGRSVYSKEYMKGASYTYYGVAVVKVEATAIFTCGNPDGNAKITSLTYSVTKAIDGFSAGGFSKSMSNGNPAYGIVRYTVTNSALGISTPVYIQLYCNNNGTTY